MDTEFILVLSGPFHLFCTLSAVWLVIQNLFLADVSVNQRGQPSSSLLEISMLRTHALSIAFLVVYTY